MSAPDWQQHYADLGRLVSAARGLEHEGYAIARALGLLDPERGSITPVLRRAVKLARKGLPPWARGLQSSDVEEWTKETLGVLDRRNRHVHWRRITMPNEEGVPIDYQQSLRDGVQKQEYAPEEVAPLASQAVALAERGRAIHRGLLFELRKGVYYAHPALSWYGEAWKPLCYYIDGEWPQRPTEDEFREWYDRLRRESPPEWATWPRARHEEQRNRNPRLSSDWHVESEHPEGVLVVLEVSGRVVRFVADPVDAEDLAADVQAAARARYSRDDD